MTQNSSPERKFIHELNPGGVLQDGDLFIIERNGKTYYGIYSPDAFGFALAGDNADITSLNACTSINGLQTIKDSNDKNVLTFNGNSNAVNYWAIANSATGVPLSLQALGTDSNIGTTVQTKGTGSYTLKSANTTTPFIIESGTSYQHKTNFLFANTSQTRNVTFQDADGTVAYLSDIAASGVNSLEGTQNQVLVNGTYGTQKIGDLVLTLPQSINTAANVTFNALTLTNGMEVGNTAIFNALLLASSTSTFTGLMTANGGQLFTVPTQRMIADVGDASFNLNQYVRRSLSTDDEMWGWDIGTPAVGPVARIATTTNNSGSRLFFAVSNSWGTLSKQMSLDYNGNCTVSNKFIGGAAFTLLNVQVFTSNGTYTMTAGTHSAVAILVGGGGGSGGCAATSVGQVAGSSGGGGGSTTIAFFTNPSAVSGTTVSIGAGGAAGAAGNNAGGNGGSTTINTSTATAPGGTGGSGCSAGTGTVVSGGAGGVAGTGGNIYIPGKTGDTAFVSTAAITLGHGGDSTYGHGGVTLADGVAVAGSVYGGGASGVWLSASKSAAAGAAGAAGICIIYEYA